MRTKIVWSAALMLAVHLWSAAPVSAQQTVNFSLGYFTLRGEDARTTDDVLVENRNLFLYDIDDFNSVSVGAEWLIPIGNYLEAGAGIAYSGRGVDTIYDQYTRPTGEEIEQELKLRIVPITATVRVLLLGNQAAIQPYVGGGIGLLNWRYTEAGEFIDFTTPRREIYRDTYEDSGASIGPVAVFGVRAPMGAFSIGGEMRYQKGEGDLNEDFLAPKIDLGGFHWNVTFGVRF